MVCGLIAYRWYSCTVGLDAARVTAIAIALWNYGSDDRVEFSPGGSITPVRGSQQSSPKS